MLTAISGDTEFSRSFSNEASYSVVADRKPPPHLPPQVHTLLQWLIAILPHNQF